MIKYTLILFLLIHFNACSFKPENDAITINKRQVFMNSNPYLIKGVCYHPVPIGSDQRNFENLEKDLNLMQKAGINTLRVYEPISDIDVLNKIDASGLKIIIGFGYNQEGNFDILSGSFLDYIDMYKNHNAILFWELGNEYNYHPEWFDNDISNWYHALNKAANLIHKHDPLHPVSTAHGELPDSMALTLCPSIDIWGMNVYRWDNPEELFSQWESVSTKPMYLSEAGADSYMTIANNGYDQGENEKAQADATRHILDDVFNHTKVCAGVTLFAFVDEWWKAGSNGTIDPGGFAPNSSGVPYDGTANEEYWGIVDIYRQPKQAYHVVGEIYSRKY